MIWFQFAERLLSVSDKTGLIEFATALEKEFKVELISTGGTAKFCAERIEGCRCFGGDRLSGDDGRAG